MLKGHPKEHQHSAWHLHASDSDARPSDPGEGLDIFLRAGWKPERAETRNPGRDPRGSASRAEAQRRRPTISRCGAPAAPNFLASGRMAARRKEITGPAVSSAPALWFGANAGARASGRNAGVVAAAPAALAAMVLAAAGRAQEVRVFQRPDRNRTDTVGGTKNSRVNRSIRASRR